MTGPPFSEYELKRIIQLLRESDLTIPQIAARLGRSCGPIHQLNRRLRIREYRDGDRTRWTVDGQLNWAAPGEYRGKTWNRSGV